MNEFQAGDMVVCVSDENSLDLTVGNEYRVYDDGEGPFIIDDTGDHWNLHGRFADDFELAEDSPVSAEPPVSMDTVRALYAHIAFGAAAVGEFKTALKAAQSLEMAL